MKNNLDFSSLKPKPLIIPSSTIPVILLLLTGCRLSTHIPPATGTTLIVEKITTNEYTKGNLTSSVTVEKKTYQQNENPKTQSTIELSKDGEVKLSAGTSYENSVSLPPETDYTKYLMLVMSLAFSGFGIFLTTRGQAFIGRRLIGFGLIGSVISMTITSYGWAYALAVLALGAYVAYQLHKEQSRQLTL